MVEQRSPKPRVESSSLSAPAKRSHDVVMASFFFAPVAPLLRWMPAQQATGGGKMPELCGETAFDALCSGFCRYQIEKNGKFCAEIKLIVCRNGAMLSRVYPEKENHPAKGRFSGPRRCKGRLHWREIPAEKGTLFPFQPS